MRLLCKMKYFIFSIFFIFSAYASNAQSDGTSNSLIQEELTEKAEVLIDSSSFYYSQGKYVESIKANVALVKIGLEIDDPKYLYRGYRYLAYDYIIMGDTLRAKENFMNAQRIAQDGGVIAFEAENQMDLANLCASSNDNHTKAIKYYKRSIELHIEANDSIGLAKAYYNAVVSGVSHKKDQAFVLYCLEAFENFKHLMAPIYSLAINYQWAAYYLNIGEYEKAIERCNKIIDHPDAEDFPVELTNAYAHSSEAYEKLKNYKKALELNKNFQEFLSKDTQVIREAQSKAISAEFEVEKYQSEALNEKEKSKLQAEITNNKNKLNNILIVLCLSGFMLIIGLFVAYSKRRDLNLALIKKNEEYLKAKEKSEILVKEKSKFFSTVSHELRTPLYGVIGLSSILLEDPQLKSHQKDLKSLKFSADYLLALINDVLQINKIDSDNLQNEVSSFNIRDFINSIATTFEYMRIQNKNELCLEIDQKMPTYLKGNVVRLSQILMNLVGNALKFTENGIITISLSLQEVTAQEDYIVKFLIKDTGIGIPKDKQATIFNEFTQVESLKYTYQGTGLGLPIVKKLLQASGSEINLVSILGKGTAFDFILPFEKVTDKVEKEIERPLNQFCLKGKNILIAEDNRINQIVTKKILERKGVHCSVAENGEEVLSLLKNNTYDLILMDLNMPVMDGLETTMTIRKCNNSIPIIALTAVELLEVRNKIYEAGMNDIIIKPYDDQKFTQIILKNLSPEIKASQT